MSKTTGGRPPAVILAAGEGSRLRPIGDREPKPLCPLFGLSLGERCVATLEAAGIDRFVVVLGHQADRVRSHFEDVRRRHRSRIEFAFADDWAKGNGVSVAAAGELVGEQPFLLTMVDHLLDPRAVTQLLAAPPGEDALVLAVDTDIDAVFDIDDVTKVWHSEGRIRAIGKELDDWNAADTGLFYGAEGLFAALETAAATGRYSLTDAVRACAGKGTARTVDVTGLPWIDVDTPEAREEAIRRLRGTPLDRER